jgi:hypothetical protein
MGQGAYHLGKDSQRMKKNHVRNRIQGVEMTTVTDTVLKQLAVLD